MKTRIIAAAVLLPLLLLMVLWLPEIVAAIVISLLMGVAVYEMLYRTRLVRSGRLVIYTAVMAVAIGIWSFLGAVESYGYLLLRAFCIALFAEMMNNHVKIRFETISMCFVAGTIVPYMLSSLIRILMMFNGRHVIMIPFVIAFLSDAGAYFAGLKFGRHKLAPVVSPNKTMEGVLGGLIASVVGMLIYGLIMQLAMDYRVNYALAILYGAAGSLAGVFGDLCFSIIKRQTGIKDYGNLIPGHGGILDRFDSMMTVAPLIEALLILLPLAEEVW